MSHGSCSGGGGGFRRGLFWDGGEATDRGYWRHCSHGPLLELHADRIPWQDHQVRSCLSVYLYLHSYLFVFQIPILDYWFWGGWEPIGREGLKSRSHQGLPKSHWIDLVTQSNVENQIITSIGGALFLLSIVISSNEPLFHEMLLLVSVLVSDFLHDYWPSRLSFPFLLTHKKEEGKWAFISFQIIYTDRLLLAAINWLIKWILEWILEPRNTESSSTAGHTFIMVSLSLSFILCFF